MMTLKAEQFFDNKLYYKKRSWGKKTERKLPITAEGMLGKRNNVMVFEFVQLQPNVLWATRHGKLSMVCLGIYVLVLEEVSRFFFDNS